MNKIDHYFACEAFFVISILARLKHTVRCTFALNKVLRPTSPIRQHIILLSLVQRPVSHG